MRDDQKTKADLLQELNTLRERVSEHNRPAEEWSKIFDATSDIVFVQDKDFKVIKVNKSACDVLKVKPEDLIGKKCYEVLHKSNKPWPNCPLAKALKDKRPHTEEVYDPNIGIPLLISTSPLFDENGELTGVVHIAKDITSRKKVEEKLKQYKFMVESAYDAIFLKDLESRYIIANNKALEAFGLSREQVIGKNDYEIIPNREEAKKNIEDDDLVFKTGKPTEITKHMTGTDGKERWFQAIKVPQFDDEGKIIGLIGIARDITEHRRAEEALKKTPHNINERIKELNCLYGLSKLVEKPNISLEGIFQGIVNLIPPSWQYPEITCVRVTFEDKEFITDNFKITKWKQSANIKVHGREVGVVEVYYLEERPESYEGAFLEEERNLIDVVAERLGRIVERKKAQEALKSERDFAESLINTTQAIVLLLDPEGRIKHFNPYMEQISGYRLEEVKGKDWFTTFLPRRDRKRIRELFLRASGGIQTRVNVNPIVTKDGCEREIEWYGKILKDANGNLVGLLTTGQDISERKKAEEQIRKLSSAVEQSIDGIAIGDLEPKLVYVNDAFAQMHGYTPENMIGMAATKLHNKSQMPEHRRHIKQLKTQGSWEGEISHIRKDGTAFLTYVSITLLKNSEGKPTGILAIARDITESKRREEELNTYRENMVRAEELASVGTLSATMAHELTQPLTVIRLSIENSLAELETTSCPDTVVEDLKEGLSEISSMTSMVNRFRHFARMSTKRTISEVDFKAVTERIVNLLDEGAWRAKVTLQVEGMDKLPLIYSYERDLEQLFFSLIENAIQAADGKKKHQVIISGAIRGEHIELQFSDNCGGIAPENLDSIFEPFFTTKHADERTGLGLCVVQRIVSQLGGKIRVESKLGKGSTFFVTLPTNRGEK